LCFLNHYPIWKRAVSPKALHVNMESPLLGLNNQLKKPAFQRIWSLAFNGFHHDRMVRLWPAFATTFRFRPSKSSAPVGRVTWDGTLLSHGETDIPLCRQQQTMVSAIALT
jgi:hypothetical protein